MLNALSRPQRSSSNLLQASHAPFVARQHSTSRALSTLEARQRHALRWDTRAPPSSSCDPRAFTVRREALRALHSSRVPWNAHSAAAVQSKEPPRAESTSRSTPPSEKPPSDDPPPPHASPAAATAPAAPSPDPTTTPGPYSPSANLRDAGASANESAPATEPSAAPAKPPIAASLDALVLPPPDPSWPKWKRWFHQGKMFLRFYWRGIKQIWFNRAAVLEVRERLRKEKEVEGAGGEKGAGMTRREFQLVTAHNADMIKLVPFAIIFLVLEEIIPLIAYYFPRILPSTVVLPSQKLSIRKDTEKRRLAAIREIRTQLASVGSTPSLDDVAATFGITKREQTEAEEPSSEIADYAERIAKLPKETLRLACGLMDLSTRGPSFLLARRLRKHLAYVAEDDALFLKEGEPAETLLYLEEGEIAEACSERGLLSLDVPEDALRQQLVDWLARSAAARADGEAVDLLRPLPLAFAQAVSLPAEEQAPEQEQEQERKA